MKSNFLKRAITGVLFVVVLVGCILYSPLSFGILFTIIGALSVHEFAHLINQNGEVQINKTITALGGAYLFLAVMGSIYYRSPGISALSGITALPDNYRTVSEKEESHWQLGLFHVKPAVCSITVCIAQRIGFPI